MIYGTSFYAVETDFEMICTHAVTECKQIVTSTSPVPLPDDEPKPPKDDYNLSKSATFKIIHHNSSRKFKSQLKNNFHLVHFRNKSAINCSSQSELVLFTTRFTIILGVMVGGGAAVAVILLLLVVVLILWCKLRKNR